MLLLSVYLMFVHQLIIINKCRPIALYMPKLGYECWLAVDKIIAKIIRLTFWGLTFQRVFSAIYLQNTVQCVCVRSSG